MRATFTTIGVLLMLAIVPAADLRDDPGSSKAAARGQGYAVGSREISLSLTVGAGNKVDLGAFAGGETLSISASGQGDLVDSRWRVFSDGSLAAPASGVYSFANFGDAYPMAYDGDGINHFAGGGANIDWKKDLNQVFFGFAGKQTTNTQDRAAIRFGAVVGTFSSSPTRADWFLIGRGTTVAVPAGGGRLNVAVNDSFPPDNHGNLTIEVIASQPVDATPPSITMSLDRQPNAAGWNNSDVTVTWAVADAESGIQSSTGCASVTLTTESGGTILTCSATNGVGLTTSRSVTVRIDKTPPILACKSVTPNLLWPPDHRLVGVTTLVEVSDNLSGADFLLQSARSNEPDNGLGDGDTPGDIQGFVVNSSSIAGLLRAERAGTGNGRVYTFRYGASDRAGNPALGCTLQVTVPRDRGR